MTRVCLRVQKHEGPLEGRGPDVALFADDLVIFAPSAQQLQEMLNIFSITANAFGQIVSDSKTEVMLPDYLLPQLYHPPYTYNTQMVVRQI